MVAPRTRIDLALPSDVAVADLLPMVLKMAGETTPDGGSRHGGWCLAKLGGAAIDPDRTLGSLGVVDGDLLQLRRRSENPPPPLFDDVVEAIAVCAPDSYRPWTERTARTIGLVAGGLALLASAVALFLVGPDLRLGAALVAGGGALATLVAGAVIARVYAEPITGVLVAAASPPLGLVSGIYLVPGHGEPENLLLGCTLALVLAISALLVLGDGITPFVAVTTAAALGALAALAGTLIDHPTPGIAAGLASVALGAISVLPRLTIQLARLPLPQVPGSAEDLQDDEGRLPDYAAIERRAGRAHEYLTGMIIGSGAVAAIGAVWASTAGAFGVAFGAVVAAVLLLRARSYANGSQAIALLLSGMVTVGGLVAGWLLTASPFVRLMLIFSGLLALAALAIVLGVIVPRRRFSPVLRRCVDVAEAILIASVLPLALGVMDLYDTFRSLA